MAYIGQTPTAVPLVAGDITDGIISEAKLAADAVSLAKMKAGTDGNIISYDASGNPVAIATGSDGQVLTSAGAGAPPAFEAAAGITLGTTIASTSGTAIDFTGIPAGTKKIFIMFTGVSTSATDYLLIQLGDSGGFETSGYVSTTAEFIGSTSVATDTTGFEMATGVAAGLVSGHMILTLSKADTFSWVSSHVAGFTNDVVVGGGHKSLSAELTQIRIDTNGSDTFDAGAINISYE
jgi:hypothetical protein